MAHKTIIVCLYFFLFLGSDCLANEDVVISDRQEARKWVTPYLLPEHHPIKNQLDKIFETGDVLASRKNLRLAGFRHLTPRRYTQVLVASHPEMPDYLFKMYTDKQPFHHHQPEWHTWLYRIWGTILIQQLLDAKGWNHWFCVPKKWIYEIPHISSSSSPLQKNYLLVVEKKDILSSHKNVEMWESKKVNKAFLKAFFYLVTSLGLHDCAKHENAPFCRDGRVAFVDTESFGTWPINYFKLTPVLSQSKKWTWRKLIKNKAKVPKSTLARSLIRTFKN